MKYYPCYMGIFQKPWNQDPVTNQSVWSNYSDLTRPISPQLLFFSKGNGTPAISGKSIGWWNIMNHLAPNIYRSGDFVHHLQNPLPMYKPYFKWPDQQFFGMNEFPEKFGSTGLSGLWFSNLLRFSSIGTILVGQDLKVFLHVSTHPKKSNIYGTGTSPPRVLHWLHGTGHVCHRPALNGWVNLCQFFCPEGGGWKPPPCFFEFMVFFPPSGRRGGRPIWIARNKL